MENFDQIFKSAKAKKMGIVLKNIIESYFENIEWNVYGGAKVKLALFSRNGTNNALCGIQEGSNESCMLYIHHVDEVNHERLKFSGKGKHAKRVKFETVEDIREDDIRWLLSKVNENAPF